MNKATCKKKYNSFFIVSFCFSFFLYTFASDRLLLSPKNRLFNT